MTELLIVIAIMGAVLGIALPLYNGSMEHAKQCTCDNQMSAIFQAEETFRLRSANRTYTTVLADLNGMPGVVTKCPSAPATGTQQYTVSLTSTGGLVVGDGCGMHKAGKQRQTTNGITFTEANCTN